MAFNFIARLIEKSPDATNNAQGNRVIREFFPADRYLFDFKYCMSSDGWKQFDTDQDASYFGVWVHIENRWTVTYCEGDLIIVTCPTVETLRAELANMEQCYGKLPPCAVAFDADGTKTEYYYARPTV